MEYFNFAICTKGHPQSDTLRCPELADKYCEKCSQPIITACPSCNTPIRGKYRCDSPSVLEDAPIPAYCRECGRPFPWTESAMEAVRMALEEDDMCTDVEKLGLIQLLPDLTVETPKTTLAALRLQKVIKKCSPIAHDVLKQFVVQLGCAAAQKAVEVASKYL